MKAQLKTLYHGCSQCAKGLEVGRRVRQHLGPLDTEARLGRRIPLEAKACDAQERAFRRIVAYAALEHPQNRRAVGDDQPELVVERQDLRHGAGRDRASLKAGANAAPICDSYVLPRGIAEPASIDRASAEALRFRLGRQPRTDGLSTHGLMRARRIVMGDGELCVPGVRRGSTGRRGNRAARQRRDCRSASHASGPAFRPRVARCRSW